MSWTQPMCAQCWDAGHPGRRAVTMLDADIERCCSCGKYTSDGIYVRVDPATVRYPSGE